MYLSSVSLGLGDVLKSPTLQSLVAGVGSLRFKHNAKNKEARLFIREGLAYSISVPGVRPEILRRIVTSEYINAETGQSMVAAFQQNLADPRILDYVKENNLMPARVVEAYLKDFFLGAGDELFNWVDVDVEWMPDEESNVFNVPSVEIGTLLKVLSNRHRALDDFAKTWTVTSTNLRQLKFKKNGSPKVYDQTNANLLSLGNGEWSLVDLSRQFGISFFSTCHMIMNLWIKGAVTIIYDNEYPIYSPGLNAQKVEDMNHGVIESVDLRKQEEPDFEAISSPEPPKKTYDDTPVEGEDVQRLGIALQKKNQEMSEVKHRIAVNQKIHERAEKEMKRDKAALSILQSDYQKAFRDFKKHGGE